MSEHIYKSHNKSLLIYHLVCPLKYRRKVLSDEVSVSLREVCLEISQRYEVHFFEIGCDEDHVHFFDSKCADVIPKKDCEHHKEFDSPRDFQIASRS